MSETVDAGHEPEELDEELEPEELDDPGPPPPLVQVYQIDGGYWACTISKAEDPDAPNIATRVTARMFAATEHELMMPRIISCLTSEFGLTQEEAEAVVPQYLVAPAPEPVSEAEPVAEAPAAEPEPAVEEPVAEQPHGPEHVHLTLDNATVEGDVRREEPQPQREA